MPDKPFKKVGKHLQGLRKIAGYKTQEDLAKPLGIGKGSVGHYETGRNLPHSRNWKKMLELLKCNSLDELFEPIIKGFKKNTEIESFIKRIKRLHNLIETSGQIKSFVKTLEKAYGLKQIKMNYLNIDKMKIEGKVAASPPVAYGGKKKENDKE